MKHETRTIITMSTLFAVLLALFPTGARTQHLYNKERDEQAQRALALAEALKSGQLFDTQLKNLASISKRDFDTEFLGIKAQINSSSLSLLTWETANHYVCLDETLFAEAVALPSKAASDQSLKELKELKEAIAKAKTSLDAFKASVKKKEDKPDAEKGNGDNQPLLTSLLGRLGDLESLQKSAEEINKANPTVITATTLKTLREVTAISGQLKIVYDAYTKRVDDFNKLEDQLANLRIVLKQVAIESLQVDEQHLKNEATIEARREVERADVFRLIREYMATMKRLKLVDFSQNQNFCVAANRAIDLNVKIDIRPRQMIADYVQELVVRAGALEKDNQLILSAARLALAKMNRPMAPAEFAAAVGPTMIALHDGLMHINPSDILHQNELNIRDGDPGKTGPDGNVNETLTGLSDDLKTLGLASHGSSRKRVDDALRLIIVHRQRDLLSIRDMVTDVPRALYAVAALIARGSTPDRLADLRSNQELHAYSIRKSAVRARAYELTVSTGAQRLALFHKGGIKPTEIAELVFAASNIALTPAILAK